MSLIKKFSIFSLIFLTFSITACIKNRIFHEVKKFEDFKWNKAEKIQFEVLIEQTEIKYDLFVNLRYIEGFPYKYLHLDLSITDPDGKTKTNELSIQIISNEKKYIGNGAGSYWDLDYPIPEYPFDKKGEYKITIEHAMEENILNWTNEVGLSIIEKEKDY
ncbi:MAG: gliding motility lipoprotein GldH [Bacteroidota bacterium]